MRRLTAYLLSLAALGIWAGAVIAGNQTSGAPLTSRSSDTLRRLFGQQGFAGLNLTPGGMAVEKPSVLATSYHSYTWTNAQVVALGAALTGDITVATLPAKTSIRNAYVVITGQGAGVTTLTVAVGRTTALFIDYIVASDAKAAAGAIYGDASAERGTNLTGYDLPSYSTTTAVKAHFISTVQNLDQTTGSTGRVILETSLIP